MTRIHSRPHLVTPRLDTSRPEAQRAPKNEAARPTPRAQDAFGPPSRTAEQLKRLGSVMSMLAPELAPRQAPPARRPAVGVSSEVAAAYDPSRSPAFREQVEGALRSLARDPTRFQAWVGNVFGAVDPARVQDLRERMARGNFRGLLPKAHMVNFDSPQAGGAYVPASRSIYLSANLEPRRAQQVYLEEVGHHLQHHLAGGTRPALEDTLGDEGAIFAASFQRDGSGRMRVTERPAMDAPVRTENDVGTLRVKGPDGKPVEVRAEFNWLSQLGHVAGSAFHHLASSVQGFGHDLAQTAKGAVSVGLDSAMLATDAVFHPERLPQDFAHLGHDTLTTLGAGWASVKDVIDSTGRTLDWVEHGLLSPVLKVVDQRFVEPAGAFLNQWMVDPANSALGGLMAKALGGDANTWKSRLEGFEGTYADYVKGVAEGAVDVVQGTLDLVFKPGETVENITRLGLLVATDPHKAWDAVSQPYREAIDSGHPAEAAGRLVANVLGMVLGPEDLIGPVSSATVSAEKLAQAGDVLAESTRSVATALENREAAAARAAEAAEGITEADHVLATERQQQVRTYDSMKDGLRGTADELDARLTQDTALTPEERARLTATRDTLRESANKVEALQVEALREHVNHVSEIEAADDVPAPGEVAVSAEQRMRMELVARTHNVVLTPVHAPGAEGLTGVLVEEPLPGSPQRLSMAEIRASLQRAGFDEDIQVWDGRDPAVKDQVLAGHVAGDPVNGLNRLRGGARLPEPVWEPTAGATRQQGLFLQGEPMKGTPEVSPLQVAEGDLSANFQGTSYNLKTYDANANVTRFYQRPAGRDGATFGFGTEVVPESKVPAADRAALHPDSTLGVHLDWEEDAATRTSLGNLPEDVRFFSTAQLDGCALIIGGTPEAPTLIHANVMERSQSLNTAKDNVKIGPDLTVDRSGQHPVTDALYQQVLDQVTANGQVPPENLSILKPSDYMKLDKGLSKINVYGVKGEAGWKFYYSATRHVPGRGFEPVTGELWPNRDLTPLQTPPEPLPPVPGKPSLWDRFMSCWGKGTETPATPPIGVGG